MKVAPRKTPKAQIPIAAMADIAMLLVIFFLVTSRLMKEAHIEARPPVAVHAEKYRTEEKSVIVDKDGGVFLNGEPSSPVEITNFLLDMIPQEGNVPKSDRIVTVKCHGKRPYGDLVDVIGGISEAGGQVVITTEQKREPKK